MTSDCAWPPESLPWMLTQQDLRSRAYNEVVFDSKPIVEGLPRSLEAFFVPLGAPGARRAAEAIHHTFLREYDVSPEEVPLLFFDFQERTPNGVHTGIAPSNPFIAPPD